MTNRQIVLDLLTKLPEDTPLESIAREIRFLAGVRTAREQAQQRTGIPAQDARKCVEAWVSDGAYRGGREL